MAVSSVHFALPDGAAGEGNVGHALAVFGEAKPIGREPGQERSHLMRFEVVPHHLPATQDADEEDPLPVFAGHWAFGAQLSVCQLHGLAADFLKQVRRIALPIPCPVSTTQAVPVA